MYRIYDDGLLRYPVRPWLALPYHCTAEWTYFVLAGAVT
jgi:hypothetical protein